jgi:hypothetical protein
MKTILTSVLLVSILSTPILRAQVPNTLSFQGQLAVNGNGHNGPGQFKFALVSVDGASSFWSNDGSSVGGSEPAQAVTLEVDHGVYSVLLGDSTLPNMTIIPHAVFSNPDVHLRIWFEHGNNGFQMFSPDQPISAVAYAMMAAAVPDGAITGQKIAPGSIDSTHLGNNAVTSADLADTLTLERLNLGGSSWDGSLYLYAKPSGGSGGGVVAPGGEARGRLLGDNLGSEFSLYFGNGQTGAVLHSRSPGGRLQLWDSLGNPTALLGALNGGGDLNLFQINGQPGIKLNGDRSPYNQNSSGGEISVHTTGGQEGLLLDGDHNNAGRIEVRQANHNISVDILGQGSGNGGELRVKGSSGNTTTVQISGAESGGSGALIALRRANNTETIVLDAETGADGAGQITVHQADGDPGAILYGAAPENGGGALSLRDPQGAPRLRAHGGPDSGSLLVYDANGTETVQLLGSGSGSSGSELRLRNGVGQLTAELDADWDAPHGGILRLFKSNGSETIRLQADNDGVGRIFCEELVVQDAGQWPDYVFADTYELMPLDTLEASIQKNKHLPGIPSAEAVQQDGLSVGDMQRRMMAKIEELTLYLLQQHKRLQTQEEQIRALQTQLRAN